MFNFTGCGINLSNSNPTTCVNDIIQDYNFNNGCYLPEIDREIYFARVFNCLEKLIDLFQQKGPEEVIKEYYKYWLHEYVSFNNKMFYFLI